MSFRIGLKLSFLSPLIGQKDIRFPTSCTNRKDVEQSCAGAASRYVKCYMLACIFITIFVGGAPALKAAQNLLQSHRIESALAAPLLELVTNPSVEFTLRVPSFLALAKLCRNSDVGVHVMNMIPSIAQQLLENTDVRMQAAAILALNNLTEHQLATEPAVVETVLESLEHCIQHPAIQRATLGYLGNVASAVDSRQHLLNDSTCLDQLARFCQAGHGTTEALHPCTEPTHRRVSSEFCCLDVGPCIGGERCNCTKSTIGVRCFTRSCFASLDGLCGRGTISHIM
jgi:hypothetical protein